VYLFFRQHAFKYTTGPPEWCYRIAQVIRIGTASLVLDTDSEQQAEPEKRIAFGSAVTTFSNAHGGTEPLNRYYRFIPFRKVLLLK
jgi:hypothetical protein